MAQLPAERQLAEHRPAVDLDGRELLGRRQQPAGRREVEARADLAQVRGREVDGDPPLRKREARVQQRGVDALARFPHGRIGAPDDRERRQARAQVDLDGDSPRGEAVDRKGRDAGKHGPDAKPYRVTEHHLIATILRRVRANFAQARGAAQSCACLCAELLRLGGVPLRDDV